MAQPLPWVLAFASRPTDWWHRFHCVRPSVRWMCSLRLFSSSLACSLPYTKVKNSYFEDVIHFPTNTNCRFSSLKRRAPDRCTHLLSSGRVQVHLKTSKHILRQTSTPDTIMSRSLVIALIALSSIVKGMQFSPCSFSIDCSLWLTRYLKTKNHKLNIERRDTDRDKFY